MQVLSLQKDADRAVVVAVTSRAVFDSGADGGDDVYGMGVAFPLLQVALKYSLEHQMWTNPPLKIVPNKCIIS